MSEVDDLRRPAGVRLDGQTETLQSLFDLTSMAVAETGDEETNIRPARVDKTGGAEQRRQIVMKFRVARTGQQGDDGTRFLVLSLHERAIQTPLAQFIKIRMTDVLGSHVTLPIPLLLERQRAENAIG